MASSSWRFLDPKEEEELHKSGSRLLNVEEKPFKRLIRHITKLHSLASRTWRLPSSPSQNGDPNGTANASSHSPTSDLDELVQLQNNVRLDFAAFDSHIARLQLLLHANTKQRAHYAAERGRILDKSQEVRESTAQLRAQLAQARETLEQRKNFDQLADKITSNPSLKSRSEQAANIAKLEEEIEQLERENEGYVTTWRERKEKFSKVLDESMRLRRQIRGEPEPTDEVGGEEDDEEVTGVYNAQTPRPGFLSGNATPRGEDGIFARSSLMDIDEDADTPREVSTTGGPTPGHLSARVSPAPSVVSNSQLFLQSIASGASAVLLNGTPSASREPSPSRHGSQTQETEAAAENMNMGDTQTTMIDESRYLSESGPSNSLEPDASNDTDVDMNGIAGTGQNTPPPADISVMTGARLSMARESGSGNRITHPSPMDSPLMPLHEYPPQIVIDDHTADNKMDTT